MLGGEHNPLGCPNLTALLPVSCLSQRGSGSWALCLCGSAPPSPGLEDSTSPRSWLGSEGPRQVGEGEPLLLSQQLLLPLPVLLKLWLWIQEGGGSRQALPLPHPQRSTSSPWSSWLVIYSPSPGPGGELEASSLKCQQLWPLPQGCNQMCRSLQMCKARTLEKKQDCSFGSFSSVQAFPAVQSRPIQL